MHNETPFPRKRVKKGGVEEDIIRVQNLFPLFIFPPLKRNAAVLILTRHLVQRVAIHASSASAIAHGETSRLRRTQRKCLSGCH